ncbi:hypothetical protein M011DRAFT_471193 [Sporormia fimetaria CBS 119925]|uniref:Uncharacterized protein n=1 Tax=Sporormia fimetaria CBS 119925 TaxID=1340428 RepID=A0A6A6V212_9PLEO|nr:hypothetical protein M011DRAFT_471193 [Sporormia fimetaria CBS 119925]
MAARTPSTLLRLLRPSLVLRTTTRTFCTIRLPHARTSTLPRRLALSHPSLRPYSSSTPSQPETPASVESAMETITDLYGTAVDEFEMAVEETEKNTTYAAEDRAAAREALDSLMRFYNNVVVEGKDQGLAEEVKRRAGQRIRELEQAVMGLEESVSRGD